MLAAFITNKRSWCNSSGNALVTGVWLLAPVILASNPTTAGWTSLAEYAVALALVGFAWRFLLPFRTSVSRADSQTVASVEPQDTPGLADMNLTETTQRRPAGHSRQLLLGFLVVVGVAIAATARAPARARRAAGGR